MILSFLLKKFIYRIFPTKYGLFNIHIVYYFLDFLYIS